MLTARDTLEDKIAGFDVGSDDYLVKPFAMEELKVRLMALVRRSQGVVSTLCAADIEVNLNTHQATRSGEPFKALPCVLAYAGNFSQKQPQCGRSCKIRRGLGGRTAHPRQL